MLGRAKGKLFRAGGLAIDKFTMASGQELTLEQLQAKYPQTFEKAGLRQIPPAIPSDASARREFLGAVSVRVENKARHYLLDEQNEKGKAKAHWLVGSLGFSPDKLDEFVQQVRYDPDAAKYSRLTEWGERFTQIIALEGPNGRVMPAKFVWQVEDEVPRLITMTPAKKKDLR